MKMQPENLEKLLKELAKDVKPDKKFMSALDKKLKIRWKEMHSAKSPFSWLSIFKVKAQFATALCGLILTSTTLYAYHSDSVIEGHLLYPLKKGTERVQSIFLDTPEEKYGYYEGLRQKRAEELNYIKQNNLEDFRAEKTTKEIQKIMKEEIKEIKKLPKEKQDVIIKNFDLSKKEIKKFGKIGTKPKSFPPKDGVIEKKPILIQPGKTLQKKEDFDFNKSFTDINTSEKSVADETEEDQISDEEEPTTTVQPTDTSQPTTIQPTTTTPPPTTSPDGNQTITPIKLPEPIITPLEPITITPPEEDEDDDVDSIFVPLNPIDLDWDFTKIFTEPTLKDSTSNQLQYTK